MTNKYTALPWAAKQADGKFISNEPYRLYAEDEGTTSSAIKDASGRVVCIVPEIHDGSFEEGERHLHLQTIVTAVNYHHKLSEALALAVDFINKHPADPDITTDQVEAWQNLVKANPEALLAEIHNLEKDND